MARDDVSALLVGVPLEGTDLVPGLHQLQRTCRNNVPTVEADAVTVGRDSSIWNRRVQPVPLNQMPVRPTQSIQHVVRDWMYGSNVRLLACCVRCWHNWPDAGKLEAQWMTNVSLCVGTASFQVWQRNTECGAWHYCHFCSKSTSGLAVLSAHWTVHHEAVCAVDRGCAGAAEPPMRLDSILSCRHAALLVLSLFRAWVPTCSANACQQQPDRLSGA